MKPIVSQIGGTDSIFCAEKFRALYLSQKWNYECLYIQITSITFISIIVRKYVGDSKKYSVSMRVNNKNILYISDLIYTYIHVDKTLSYSENTTWHNKHDQLLLIHVPVKGSLQLFRAEIKWKIKKFVDKRSPFRTIINTPFPFPFVSRICITQILQTSRLSETDANMLSTM